MPIRSLLECSCVIVLLLLIGNHEAARLDPRIPQTCYTPMNVVGSCVPLERCKSLLDLTINNPGAEVDAYMQKSSCRHSELLCCPKGHVYTTPLTPLTPVPTPLATPVTSPKPPKPATPVTPPSLLPMECGRRESDVVLRPFKKIVDGVPAVLGEYPWMVNLGFRTKDQPKNAEPQWGCAGALITNKLVLTAAHCPRNGRRTMYIARVGELSLANGTKDGATPRDIRIKRVEVHRKYVPGSYEYDIAIVVLRETVTFSRNVKPICLPFSPEFRKERFESQLSEIAGWGTTKFKEGRQSENLLKALVRVTTNGQCEAAYADEASATIDEKVICASGGSSDSCQGDSGGPLMAELNGDGTYHLIGIVSFGIGCGNVHVPGVYTRVTAFEPWIMETIKSLERRS